MGGEGRAGSCGSDILAGILAGESKVWAGDTSLVVVVAIGFTGFTGSDPGVLESVIEVVEVNAEVPTLFEGAAFGGGAAVTAREGGGPGGEEYSSWSVCRWYWVTVVVVGDEGRSSGGGNWDCS